MFLFLNEATVKLMIAVVLVILVALLIFKLHDHFKGIPPNFLGKSSKTVVKPKRVKIKLGGKR